MNELKTTEYIKVLQIEYINAELRFNMYKKDKDKAYWRDRVMKGKRERIELISLKLALPNIFTKDERGDKIRDKYYRSVYNQDGFPNFTYTNLSTKDRQQVLDKLNYYSSGSEIKITLDNLVLKGEVITIYLNDDTVMVKLEDGTLNQYHITRVKRIDINNPYESSK